MFDRRPYAHDDAVRQALGLRDELVDHVVADAFVASLATRRLERRSALGSFAALRNMNRHDSVGGAAHCLICGGYRGEGEQDVNRPIRPAPIVADSGEIVADLATPGDAKQPDVSAALPAEPVEVVLARALSRAADAGRWDIVTQLAKELEAMRLAHAGNVVRLDDHERRRR